MDATTRPRHPPRRIAAVIFPRLALELAQLRLHLEQPTSPAELPLAVVLTDAPGSCLHNAPLDAVNPAAHRHGIDAGQGRAEALATWSTLRVVELPRAQVRAALEALAEVALGLAPTVSLEAPDTLWLDVSGLAHGYGGEAELLEALQAELGSLGHQLQLAVASGPRLAAALARWGATPSAPLVATPQQLPALLARLPIRALPLTPEQQAWLLGLGVLSVGELTALPRAEVLTRLGPQGSASSAWWSGHDDTPLSPFQPAGLVVEQLAWETPLEGLEPLRFALRRLSALLSTRLAARAEAATTLTLRLSLDPAVARLQGQPAEATLRLELGAPLWREEDLLRVVSASARQLELAAPLLGVALEASRLASAAPHQLSLAPLCGGLPGQRGPARLPVLLAELSVSLGKQRVGVLEVVDSHRPEARSRLVSAQPRAVASRRGRSQRRSGGSAAVVAPWAPPEPTRWLPRALPVTASLRAGAPVLIERRPYVIERLRLEQRLEAVEWWAGTELRRDYVRAELEGQAGALEAWLYVDRRTGRRYLQGLTD